MTNELTIIDCILTPSALKVPILIPIKAFLNLIAYFYKFLRINNGRGADNLFFYSVLNILHRRYSYGNATAQKNLLIRTIHIVIEVLLNFERYRTYKNISEEAKGFNYFRF